MPLKRPLDLRPFVGGRVGWPSNGFGFSVDACESMEPALSES